MLVTFGIPLVIPFGLVSVIKKNKKKKRPEQEVPCKDMFRTSLNTPLLPGGLLCSLTLWQILTLLFRLLSVFNRKTVKHFKTTPVPASEVKVNAGNGA